MDEPPPTVRVKERERCPTINHTLQSCLLQAKVECDRSSDIQSRVVNGMACYSADSGQLDAAQNWINKLDCGVSSRTLDRVIRAAVKARNLDGAEDWFERAGASDLHPELAGAVVPVEDFDLMICASAKAHDLMRAESYMRKAGFGLRPVRPSLSSFLALIDECLHQGNARRAHHWCSDLVLKGCSKRPNYSPDAVKLQKRSRPSERTWSASDLLDIVAAVARSLAACRNPAAASHWLQYLSDCGLSRKEAPITFADVQAAQPKEVPTKPLKVEAARLANARAATAPLPLRSGVAAGNDVYVYVSANAPWQQIKDDDALMPSTPRKIRGEPRVPRALERLPAFHVLTQKLARKAARRTE